MTAAFLLGAQRYGLKVVPELHPRADELLWTARTKEEFERRLLVSASGATNYEASNGSVNRPPFYNALAADISGWYRDMVGELADQYKHYPAFAGVQLRISNWQNPALNNLVSLDWGYDAETVSRFFRETGLPIPDGILQKDDAPAEVQNRHDVILATFRKSWIRWRCEQVRDLFRDIVHRVRQARSDLIVQVSLVALSNAQQPGYDDLREMGIDLELLHAVDGMVLIDGRFQHGAREASIDWQRMTREGHLGSNGVRLFEGEKTRASTIFPMQYVEITGGVATSQQLGWAPRRTEPWVSASSEPPGRLRLARYAELVGLFDVYMLGDGGNGYVFSGEGLKEFMVEFRALPRRPFERIIKAPSTVILRRNDKDFYAVSLSSNPQAIRISLKGASSVRRVTTGEPVPLRNGVITLDLKPYELIVFEADRQITDLAADLTTVFDR